MKKRNYLIAGIVAIAAASSWYWTSQAVEQPPPRLTAEIQSEQDSKLQALAADSELIVTGRCVETRVEWVENNRILVTLAKIQVDETLKGGAQSTITVVLPGGVDANRRIPVAMTYPGAPNITEGEEVFLFLTAESLVSGGYAVSGFANGKFSIVKDENGNRLIANGPVRGTVKANGNSGERLAPLAQFKSKVRSYAGQ